jgi:hypothetical protein
VRVHTKQGWVGELVGVRVAQGPMALVVNLGRGLARTLWAVHERNGANDKNAARARSINSLSLACSVARTTAKMHSNFTPARRELTQFRGTRVEARAPGRQAEDEGKEHGEWVCAGCSWGARETDADA